MIVDFSQTAPAFTYQFDICIVGSGPAGTSLALEFVGEDKRVCLIESGGIESDGETQALYEGESVGFAHTELDACRLRFFGGSSNCWNGWCMPFDREDFEPRPWIPGNGWPIRYSDLEPYYLRAGTVCEIGAQAFDGAYWREILETLPAFDETKIRMCHWRDSPPTRFGERYRADLEQAPNVLVLLNANVIELNLAENGRSLTSVQVSDLSGKQSRISAGRFVLACGGIETPRLLLASRRHTRRGIGNRFDQVGRCFMEHPYATSAIAYSRPGTFLPEVMKRSPEASVQTAFCLSPSLQRTAQVVGSMMLIERQENVDHLFSWGRRDLPDVPPGYERYILLSQSEQVPDPESRVTLSDHLDALGQPRARLDWRVNRIDKHSVRIQAEALGAEFARLGLGRIKLADWLLDEDAYWGIGAGNHHMGTTRMGSNPQTSVVDANCKVHSVENLYIAGSSVFSTSSWTNPTLTIVALSIRLADHLKS